MGTGIENLLAGFRQFEKGAKSFALGRALGDADEARQQIQQSDLEQKEKDVALRQLGQRTLGAIGGLNPTAAQVAIIQGIAPKEPAKFQTAEAAFISGAPEQRERATELIEGKRADVAAKQVIKQAETKRKETVAVKKLIEIDFQKLTKASATPSSRRRPGRLEVQVDASDNLLAIFQSKVPSDKPLSDMTPAERIKVLNKLDIREVRETAVVLNRLLSQAAGTESGIEHLTPSSLFIQSRALLEQVLNEPVASKAGAFMEKFYQTVTRERSLAVGKLRRIKNQFRSGFKRAFDSDPERFEKIIKGDSLKFDLKAILEGRPGVTDERALRLEQAPIFGVQPGQGATPQGAAPAQGSTMKDRAARFRGG